MYRFLFVYFIGSFVFLTCSCGRPQHQSNTMQTETDSHPYTNALVHETSPYLLQHAHNPVNWYPWGEEALQKAREEDKMLLVSIGYSSCHWCHVMEHESFEDTAVAAIMNAHFLCVKVDREERPDVDQVYMDAIQLLTRHGGWPLNCFAMPDGRPFYGGTYFTKDQWVDLLEKVADQYANNRTEVEEFADKLTQGVVESDLIERNEQPPLFHREVLDVSIRNWSKHFDPKYGGTNRAPKFPLPTNYQFLLRYAVLAKDGDLLKHVETTLDNMALGGIYDQLGGGFARYSTDEYWKVPHFEKMLYDNGQLIQLYSEAYRQFKKPLYRDVVYETIAFCQRELSNGSGIFYSALDADSEGEEGKFYVWKKAELEGVLESDFDLAKSYYNINSAGFWELGNYILLRTETDEEFAAAQKLELDEWKRIKERIKRALLEERSTRTRPGLDDKSLTSWNALMLHGLVEAYRTFEEPSFLATAFQTADFLQKTQRMPDGGLWHTYKEGTSRIPGYLEDYCFTIEAFIALYEVTFNEAWLNQANTWMEYVLAHFYNAENGMFYFTSSTEDVWVARKTELEDGVIPASNSSIAKSLFYLGQLLDKEDYRTKAEVMLNNVQNGIPKYGPQFSNWGQLLLHQTFPYYEVAIVGKEVEQQRLAFQSASYYPNLMVLGSEKASTLPLLEYKLVEGETPIYVCENKTCQLPTTDVQQAWEQITW